MAVIEDQPNEILQDGNVQQQEGFVQRNVITGSQNENYEGIHIPKQHEASACLGKPVADGNEIRVSCQNDSRKVKEDDVNDVLVAKPHCGPASETKSRSPRNKEVPQPLSNGADSYTKQNTPGRKGQEIIQQSQNLTGGSLSQEQFVVLIFLIIICDKSLVDATRGGVCGISSVILDCEVSRPTILAGRTTIVKEGVLKSKDPNFRLVDDGNLEIIEVSDAYLQSYQCETSPRSDYVREFPLKDLNQLCCSDKGLEDNTRASIEMSNGSEIFYLNITYFNGVFKISSATKAIQHMAGRSYCNITAFGKSKAQTVKPAMMTVIITCVIMVLLASICG